MKNLFVTGLFFFVFMACSNTQHTNESKPEKIEASHLVGSWSSNMHIDSQKSQELFGATSEVKLEIRMSGIEEFEENGNYNTQGEISMQLGNTGEEIVLNYDIRVSGKWELRDSTVSINTEDGDIKAADEATQTLIEQVPDLANLAAAMKPRKGSTSTVQIISINEDVMQYQPQHLQNMVITANRKK